MTVKTYPYPHGTANGYDKYGCRCAPCRETKSHANRAHRARGLPPDSPRHGTVSGYNSGCRCQRCTTAKATYQRARRARQRANAALRATS